MKPIFVLMLALAATIAWQTSVRSENEPIPAMGKDVDNIQQENRQAGRTSFDEEDCD